MSTLNNERIKTSRGLPLPTAEEAVQSLKLQQKILSAIKENGGVLTFAHYMELALYEKELGYYTSSIPKFGKRGDYVTAPLVSPLFSYCLANQCQQILTTLGKGDILEIGAGNGKMAADILLELSHLGALPEHYFILEKSDYLKKQQQRNIFDLCPELYNRLHWIDALPENNFQGVILANEVLDAFAVNRFHITEHGIQELYVTGDNGLLSWQSLPTDCSEFLELYQSQAWPINYISEINLNLKPWLKSLSNFLNTGVILLIDYGFSRHEYYHPDRNQGTLMCHYKHYATTDPFLYPGLQDLTAHVDFTAVLEEALENELDILGYTHQAAFLLGCGLLDKADTYNNYQQQSAINTLTSPAEMGELFKVMALGRNFDEFLMGFSISERSGTLLFSPL